MGLGGLFGSGGAGGMGDDEAVDGAGAISGAGAGGKIKAKPVLTERDLELKAGRQTPAPYHFGTFLCT